LGGGRDRVAPSRWLYFNVEEELRLMAHPILVLPSLSLPDERGYSTAAKCLVGSFCRSLFREECGYRRGISLYRELEAVNEAGRGYGGLRGKPGPSRDLSYR
jgi:hypothetical protein